MEVLYQLSYPGAGNHFSGAGLTWSGEAEADSFGELGAHPRVGAREAALLERVLRSLGSKTSWARMSREMAVELQPAPGRNA